MALELDARRRAMLQEMGIAVWMPEAAAPSAGASAAEAPAVAADPRAVRAPAAGDRPPGPDASGVPPAAAPGDPRAEPPVPSAAPRAGSGAAGPSGAAATSAPAPVSAAAAAGRGDPAQPAASAPSRGPAAGAQPAAARRPGEGPAVSLGDWQLLHDGAPRAAAGPGPEGSAPDAPAAAPEPRAPQEPRTWLLLTESSTPADLCAAQDPAGRLLAAMLRAVQYGGPVRVVGAPVRPAAPAGAEGAAAPGAGAGLADGLEEAVARHRPVLVLALGRLASQAVLGTREPLGRLRGRLHAGPVAGVPVVATYDAGYLLRAPADKARAWADLCLGLEQVRVPPAS